MGSRTPHTLPLPLAWLRRRARNAQSPKERHDTAFFAWEASLRLQAAANPPKDLSQLLLPSTGHWAKAAVVSESPNDDPRLLASFCFLSECTQGKHVAPKTTSVRKVIDLLPPYRNQVLGHGSTRSVEFYEKGAAVLLEALDAAWESHGFFPEAAKLVYVDAVEIGPSGDRRARIVCLEGLASTVESPGAGTPVPAHVLPRRLYLQTGDDYRCLHPMLLFQEKDLRERVLFFNGRRKTSKFLDYVSGEELKGEAAAQAFPDLEKDCDELFAACSTAEVAAESEPAGRFAGYQLLGKLGEGGMGVVHLARQESLGRLVALKTLAESALDDAVAVARFQREVAALSRCDHPNVVKILASGESRGAHYYTMELIDGADLTSVGRVLPKSASLEEALSCAVEDVRKRRKEVQEILPEAKPVLSTVPRERLRAVVDLFLSAARGVAYLHSQGIIHRDIKPANIMLTALDRRLVIMDLGLAVLADTTKSLTRDARSVLGTLRYMPPEQLHRNLGQVDRRADIYSLGATFYELLTERAFHDADSEAGLINQVLHEQPLEPRKANPRLPADLATILNKATQKDPRLRYATADALADDLEAFLSGRAISARPPSLTYLLSLAARRHRLGVAAGILGLLAIVGGTLGYLQRERTLRGYAEQQLERAEKEKTRGDRLYASFLEEQGRTELLKGNNAEAALFLSTGYSLAPERPVLQFLLADAMRSFDVLSATLRGHHGPVRSVVFSPGGARIATGGEDGTVRVWNASSGEQLSVFDAKSGPIQSVRFSNKGDLLVVFPDSLQESLWDLSQKTPARVPLPERHSVLAISQNDTAVLTVQDRRSPTLHLLTGATSPHPLQGAALGVVRGAFSSDGSCVGVATDEGKVLKWSVETGALVGSLETKQRLITELDLDHRSEDEAAIVVDNKTQIVFDWKTGRLLRSSEHTHDTEGHSTLASSKRFLITTSDGWLPRLVVRGSETVLQALDGHRDRVTSASFSPDETKVVTASADGTAMVWSTEKPGRTVSKSRGVWGTRLSPCGRYVVSRTLFSRVQSGRFSALPGATCACKTGYGSGGKTVAFSANGAVVALACEHGAVLCGTSRGDKLVEVEGHKEDVRVVALSSDGRRLLTAGDDKSARLWHTGKGEPGPVLGPHPEGVVDGEISPDGKLVVTVSRKSAWLWSVSDGKKIGHLKGHKDEVHAAVFSPDSRLVVTVSSDRTARIWDVTSAESLAKPTVLEGHLDPVVHVAFNPKGNLLLTCSYDGTARIWDATTAKLVASLKGHKGAVYVGEFSTDGQRVATGGSDGTVRLWSSSTGRLLATLEPSERASGSGWITSLGFTPDGSRLFVGEANGQVALVDVHLESRPPATIAEIVKRRAPWELVEGQLVPVSAKPP